MARVVFSALISDMRGRLNGNVFSFCRGVHYLKAYNPNPVQPDSELQQAYKAALSYYSGLWSGIEPTIKQMWVRYGSRIKSGGRGFNSFLNTNMKLFSTKHADLTFKEHPPLSVYTPRSINGFSVTSVDSVTNRLSWSAPLTEIDYVQAYQSLDKNYIPGYNKYWSHIQTVRGDVGEIIHSHNYPVGVHVYYKMRTIESFGRVSPKTHVITTTVPS
jgi:hypothetical protein